LRKEASSDAFGLIVASDSPQHLDEAAVVANIAAQA